MKQHRTSSVVLYVNALGKCAGIGVSWPSFSSATFYVILVRKVRGIASILYAAKYILFVRKYNLVRIERNEKKNCLLVEQLKNIVYELGFCSIAKFSSIICLEMLRFYCF